MITKKARILLLMLRCGYISGQFKLTLKGTLGLPASVWRAWNWLLIKFKPSHRQDVIAYLSSVRDRSNPMNTPTPETDAAWKQNDGESHYAFIQRKIATCEKLERERDEYAATLCEAMRWVYACFVTNQNRADMINRFEALELTPALSQKNQTPP